MAVAGAQDDFFTVLRLPERRTNFFFVRVFSGDEALRALDAKLLLQVHDELLLEVPEAAAQEAGERVAALMANVRPGGIVLDVPLKADWGAAENWGDAH